ncbi:unnamed protein product (macronuclear) [Paramecium tetraurelia]|uniref:Chromosome undetermined scaffold_1, whole genome shotgun sequence n=1 Tax=Paramecium tetraurelia TaxID=5888 RepID=Q6BG05_PARTE|nr:hypothetical protein [Paramecium tetraurelia strain d4-2]XP_001423265.1 uncharacterized protein GSPATT00000302001 [Paramecium tetraurelia]CAH03415.1 hypothetical protein PTMB.218c [Paramecium tetraurelia]CAK55867.1 unnamed protein product [Paramecium tetraurelia]|eukprot:XP_001423265.1 hypothetical protein (macronuclear) [Paramecium tetraurelia strain d4-2]
MQYKKNYPNIQFDLSIDQFRLTDDEIILTTNLTKRPKYQIKNIQQTANCISQVVKENEIKKRPQIEIQKELCTPKRPLNQHLRNYDSLLFPFITTKQSHLPNFLELSKLIKLTETPRISNNIKLRSRSTDQRITFHKSSSIKKLQTDVKNIEEQFQETRNLIKRFNRIKRKQVRFDVST